MVLSGLYGITDAGKTTICDTLCEKATKKSATEVRRGITMTVGYSSHYTQTGKGYYFLDNPGHKIYSPETLRNVDLLDLMIYVVDSTAFKPTSLKKQYSQRHYQIYRELARTYQIPLLIILNKADLLQQDQLSSVGQLFAEDNLAGIVPLCARAPQSYTYLNNFLNSFEKVERHLKTDVIFRAIKSFNVNPDRTPLTNLKGGVLGGYFFKPIEGFVNVFDNLTKKPGIWKIRQFRPFFGETQGIATIETGLDPLTFEQNLRRGTILFEKPFELTNHIEVKLQKAWRPLFKDQNVLILYQGTLTSATIKKINKKVINVYIKETHIIKPPVRNNAFCLILPDPKDNEDALVIATATIL